MSNKLYLLAALCVCVIYSGNINAQCPAGRFVTEIFPTYSLDSVTYSTPYSLKMDIYQPTGDTMAARPLIILGHGGSFVSGTREDDSTVDWLCQNFARRGYVTASIDYRLGNIFSMVSDSSAAIDVVVKAISDGKAAIRYFVQDAATTNTYKIDTNHIFIGGNSAGAVLYMHVGYIPNLAACPADLAAAMATNGGFEGNSGNPGYTTRYKAVINLAGALNTPALVSPWGTPSVNAQGDADVTVPYNCAYPLSGTVHVTLCGLGQLEPAYVARDVYHMSKVFPGDTHVPWATDPAKFYTVDSLVTQFLYNLVCTNVAGVNDVHTNTDVSLYPNPASECVNVKSSELLSTICVTDQVGRVVAEISNINRLEYELNTSHLSAGVYFVKMKFANENNTPIVKQVVVE